MARPSSSFAASELQVVLPDTHSAGRMPSPQPLSSAQELLLPRRLPRPGPFDLAGYCHTSQLVGGDFYDVLSLPNGKTWLLIADVMGKGVFAALLAATVRGLARMLVRMNCTPSAVLRELNDVLFDELAPSGAFVTAQAVLLDTKNNQFLLANAGHCPGLVSLNDGASLALAPEGIPLGIFPETSFADELLDLSRIQTLLLHTDGLTDALSPQGERFGLHRLRTWVAARSLLIHSAADFKQELLTELSAFQAGQPHSDDQTFLVLARQPFSR